MGEQKVRIIAIAMAFAMLAAFLVACRNDDPPAPDQDSQDQASPVQQGEAQQQPEEDDATHITYAMWGGEDELSELNDAIARFHAGQDRIRVTPIQVDRGGYVAWLDDQAAAGALPDTAMMPESQVLDWHLAGALLPLGDMFDGSPEAPLDTLAFHWDDEVIGHSATNQLLNIFYDRDKFAAAGIDTPPASARDAWSWQQFVEAAKTMTLDANGNDAHSRNFDRDNVEQYGVVLDPATWMLEAWTMANNGGFYDPRDPLNVIVNAVASADAIQMIADLHLVHGVSPRFGAAPPAAQPHPLANAAMYIGAQDAIGGWLGDAKNNEGLNYGVGVLPSMRRNVTLSTGAANVAFSASPNQEAAKEWLAWYAQVENSWGRIESGARMPIYPVWYTEEAKMREWAENPNFPPFGEYRSAVIEYAMSNAQPAAWHWVPNTELFNDVLSTVLAPVWSGQQAAHVALESAIGALRAVNSGGS